MIFLQYPLIFSYINICSSEMTLAQLISINSNSSSSSINNKSSSSGTTGNNNSNDHSSSIRRIGDDSTLYDLISSDRSLVMFLMMLGMYIDDDNNSYAVKIIARIWQMCLLVFGGVGFCWFTFIFGGHDLVYLYKVLTSSSCKSIGVFSLLGFVLYGFIVPLVQVTSLMYGINNVYKHMHQPVNTAIVSPLLASCKRSAIVYFICQ